MDARHEMFQQKILNQIIHAINSCLTNSMDDLLTNDDLDERIEIICTAIYQFAGLEVNISGIMSKHNLLSIDVVLFPLIPELENKKNFSPLISVIKHSCLNPFSSASIKLCQQIEQIVQDNVNK